MRLVDVYHSSLTVGLEVGQCRDRSGSTVIGGTGLVVSPGWKRYLLHKIMASQAQLMPRSYQSAFVAAVEFFES
jgi:hypothetical protein